MAIGRTNVGGAALNLKVVGGTSQPASPAENTIWVSTETAISEWVFSAVEPTAKLNGSALSGGEVWFKTNIVSSVAINVLKGKNGAFVYPYKCYQYVDGAWVGKAAKTYQNGEWVDWVVWFYDQGNQHLENGGAWTSDYNTEGYAKNNPAVDAASIRVQCTAQGQVSPIGKTEAIDVTHLSTLCIRIISASGQSLQFNLMNEKSINQSSCAAQTYVGGSGIISLDVSHVTGAYYLLVMAFTPVTTSADLRFDQIWGY